MSLATMKTSLEALNAEARAFLSNENYDRASAAVVTPAEQMVTLTDNWLRLVTSAEQLAAASAQPVIDPIADAVE